MFNKNCEVIDARFTSDKQDRVVVAAKFDGSDQIQEITVEAAAGDAKYESLLKVLTVDQIHKNTKKYNQDQKQVFQEYVKAVGVQYGLLYNPEAENPNSRLQMEYLFNLPTGDAGMDFLFELKLRIFDIPEIVASNNEQLREELREAETPLKALYVAGKFLYE